MQEPPKMGKAHGGGHHPQPSIMDGLGRCPPLRKRWFHANRLRVSPGLAFSFPLLPEAKITQ